MNRRAWVAWAVTCAAAVTVSADAGTTTVVGCVQNISAKGTRGPTEKGYLLTNVTSPNGDPLSLAPTPSEGTTTTGAPTGTSGTAAPGMPASGTWGAATGSATPRRASRTSTSFMLDGHQNELKAQVGHKVEITGTLQPAQSPAPKGEESHLQVDAVRPVASKCTSK